MADLTKIRNLKADQLNEIAVGEIVLNVDAMTYVTKNSEGNVVPYLIRPYKVWAALCTDGGTMLGAQVLVNELGGTVVFSKLGDGNFRGTLAGAFPVGRTVSPQNQEFCYSPDLEGNYNLLVLTVNNNYFDIVTRDTAFMSLPDALQNKFIEIRVYD